MTSKTTCGTISELGLTKLSSDFSTLASSHTTVDILRGLPEGSRLSTTLFGIFVADLVHELRAKFPHKTRLAALAALEQDFNTIGVFFSVLFYARLDLLYVFLPFVYFSAHTACKGGCAKPCSEFCVVEDEQFTTQ